MRSVIWFLLLAIVAVVGAVTFGPNDGLVSIYWGGWRTDLSLNLFVIAALAFGALALVAAQAVVTLVTLPQRASEWRALRRERAAQAALREAQAEFFSGRFSRAHKAAKRALDLHAEGAGTDREFAVLAHLLAAGSLHRLSDRSRRDEQLDRLNRLMADGQGSSRADDGARLLVAEWALEDRDAARANALLAELPPGVARRTHALRLKLRAARQANAPLEALHTARLLANHQAFSPGVAQSLLRSLASEALRGVHDAEQLRRLWQRLDNADRRDPQLVARAAERAAELGAPEDGRSWLAPFWDRLDKLEPDERERLSLALMRVTHGIGVDWLPRLEAASRSFGRESAVLAAVGVAYAERQLWGKARQALEAAVADTALAVPARRLAWRGLAAMAREQGDDARASACDRAAAEL
jgi:HemY protein